MKTKNRNASGTIIALIVFLAFRSCNKNDNSPINDSGFILSSPEIGIDSLLPIDSTCDRASSTLSLMLTGEPGMVTRKVLLNAIESITLSRAKMTVYYSRNIK